LHLNIISTNEIYDQVTNLISFWDTKAFGQMVGVQYAVILFSIVFLVKGKQIRRWTANFGPVKRQADALAAANITVN
jgi:hypothetical protein